MKKTISFNAFSCKVGFDPLNCDYKVTVELDDKEQQEIRSVFAKMCLEKITVRRNPDVDIECYGDAYIEKMEALMDLIATARFLNQDWKKDNR